MAPRKRGTRRPSSARPRRCCGTWTARSSTGKPRSLSFPLSFGSSPPGAHVDGQRGRPSSLTNDTSTHSHAHTSCCVPYAGQGRGGEMAHPPTHTHTPPDQCTQSACLQAIMTRLPLLACLSTALV
eukprot:scaffold189739_cov31-Tisochrysis_lutea.AAC.1